MRPVQAHGQGRRQVRWHRAGTGAPGLKGRMSARYGGGSCLVSAAKGNPPDESPSGLSVFGSILVPVAVDDHLAIRLSLALLVHRCVAGLVLLNPSSRIRVRKRGFRDFLDG